ncbi:MAG: hypothetical protein P8X74_11855 [Reinekea sp.]
MMQWGIAKAIVAQDSDDYILAVKANQPSLYEANKKTFACSAENPYEKPCVDYVEQEEVNRDRLGKRNAWSVRQYQPQAIDESGTQAYENPMVTSPYRMLVNSANRIIGWNDR